MTASAYGRSTTSIHRHGYRITQPTIRDNNKHSSYAQLLRPVVLLLNYLLSMLFLIQLWKSSSRHLVARYYFGVQLMLFAARLVRTGWRLICNSEIHRPQLRLIGSHVPHVDVIITTCGEDLEVILDTVRACCLADYPISRRRVLVSDDAADDELRQIVQELNQQAGLNLLYFSRNAKGGRKAGAKAGNMNSAIKHLDALNGGEAYPYAIFVDADMIVEPAFLRAELAHMLMDDSVALVVLPQNFYNIPVNDPLDQSLNAQQKFDEVLRDSAQAAWNSGSSALVRRSAIKEIGGFPEFTLTEDVMTSTLLQGLGWQVVYCNEPLQWGLVPDTLRAHIKQRVRWSVGAFRNARHHLFGADRFMLPRMTFRQRYLAFTEGARCWFSTPVEVASHWILLALLTTGQPLIVAEDLTALLKTNGAVASVQLAYDFLESSSAGYITMRRRDWAHDWLSPYLAAAFLQEMIPSWLGGFRVQFVPSGVSNSALLERKKELRPPLMERLYIMVMFHGLWYHVVLLTTAGAVFASTVYQCMQGKTDIWQFVHRHLLVPGLQWEFYLSALQPLCYAVSPPSMPSRRSFMQVKERMIDGQQHQHAEINVWRAKQEQEELSRNHRVLLTTLPHLIGQLYWITLSSVF